MDIKKDIETREDIRKFLIAFYEQVKQDPLLGVIFNEVAHVNWDHHIPLITDFWESILLDNPVYSNNAMAVHHALNKIYPLQEKHFKTWLAIFNTIIDAMYEGPVTVLAKKRAASIASLMQHSMGNSKIL